MTMPRTKRLVTPKASEQHGLPVEVGLSDSDGNEPTSLPGYERKPWALQVRWDFPGSDDPGPEFVAAFVDEYDHQGARVGRRPLSPKVCLCSGDSLTFTLEPTV
jgi:hypothetical protein